MKYQAIVFDVDRTLLDTEQFIFQAYFHTLRTKNLPSITEKDLNHLMGKSLEICYGILAPNHDVAELMETHRSFQDKNLHLSIPFPQTFETLKAIKKAGIKIGAVTTRSKRTSGKTLELAGLMAFIDTVISREDVSHDELKPHPRPILLALNQLNILPEHALMIGDAKEDIEAGKRAGTKTIGVTYGSLGKKIKKSNPDYTIDDIAEILPLVL